MKVSVVTAAYNCLDLLKHCLASLENQDIGADNFQVIVIDDGSQDGTGDYLRDYSGSLNLEPILNETNIGRAASRNLGIKRAQAPLTVFLDADMEVDPDFLRRHLEAQSGGFQVSVGKVVFHESLEKSPLMRYLEKRGAAKLPPGAEIPGRYFLSCNASVPTRVLLDAGGFDENFWHYGGEDIDLGLRLAEKIPLRSLPSAISRHRHYRDLDSFIEVIRGYGRHSLPYLIKKHPHFFRDLKLDRHPAKSLRDLVIKSLSNRYLYTFAKRLISMGFAFDPLFSYLIFNNYRQGLMESGFTFPFPPADNTPIN